jgi:gliding motility-associated-like protein
VTVNPTPLVILTGPSPAVLCEGSSTLLTASGGITYKWYFNGTEVSGVTTATLDANAPGSYTVIALSSNGCISNRSTAIILTLIKKPVADFSYSGYCKNLITNFENRSTISASGPVDWRWDFGDNTSFNGAIPTHTYLNAGRYTITLTVVPQYCPQLAASLSKIIVIESPTQAIRYPAKNLIQNSAWPLEARQIGNSYKWTPSRGLNNYTTYNPTFNFNLETDYRIEITAASGCVTVDSQLVRTFSVADIKVPSAFSPNKDGHNDELDVFLIGIDKLLYFRVFNRWGQLLYETKDPLQRWDGRYKGANQPLETYVWIAEGITPSGNKIIRRGQTILLR